INQDSAPTKVEAESSKNKRQLAFLLEEYWYPGAGNLIKLGFSKIKKVKKTNLIILFCKNRIIIKKQTNAELK
ncbi:hypothetical protein KKG80_02535, partial [Patescibacteria group bacterium]|nr:hypothetical protein [Patescibacteria group bacterium]